MLYQLSYFRKSGEGNETRTHTTILSLPPQSSASTNSAIPPSIFLEILFYVPRTGLEPARLSTLAPETSASTIPPPGQAFVVRFLFFRAENEARTRDPNLGKVMLYQLSYFRIFPQLRLFSRLRMQRYDLFLNLQAFSKIF